MAKNCIRLRSHTRLCVHCGTISVRKSSHAPLVHEFPPTPLLLVPSDKFWRHPAHFWWRREGRRRRGQLSLGYIRQRRGRPTDTLSKAINSRPSVSLPSSLLLHAAMRGRRKKLPAACSRSALFLGRWSGERLLFGPRWRRLLRRREDRCFMGRPKLGGGLRSRGRQHSRSCIVVQRAVGGFFCRRGRSGGSKVFFFAILREVCRSQVLCPSCFFSSKWRD